MTLTITEYNPEKAKIERELELKKRRKQYPIPLSEETRNEILRRCEILRYLEIVLFFLITMNLQTKL